MDLRACVLYSRSLLCHANYTVVRAHTFKVLGEQVVALLLGADANSSTQRLAACGSLPLPPAFVQYLNTSFLGQRQFVQAGDVNFTYYQFGPLNVQAKGIPCSKTLHTPVVAILMRTPALLCHSCPGIYNTVQASNPGTLLQVLVLVQHSTWVPMKFWAGNDFAAQAELCFW